MGVPYFERAFEKIRTLKKLFNEMLSCREFGSSLLQVKALFNWLQEKGIILPISLEGFDVVQIEGLLCEIERSTQGQSAEHAAAKVSKNLKLTGNTFAEIAPGWLCGAEAANQWRETIRKAISNNELVPLDSDSFLPVEQPTTDTMVEAVPAIKQGLTKGAVINAFNELHFNRDQWEKALSDVPKWLVDCRLTMGSRGKKVSATWHPVLIAAALLDKNIEIRKLDAAFVNLKEWRDEWRETSALLRD